MPLSTAQNLAWNLARTLMVPVILFRNNQGFGVLPGNEFDGAAETILTEYHPFPA